MSGGQEIDLYAANEMMAASVYVLSDVKTMLEEIGQNVLDPRLAEAIEHVTKAKALVAAVGSV